MPPQNLQLVNATRSTLTIEWVEPHAGNHTHFIGYVIRIRSVNDHAGKWKYIETNSNTFRVNALNASALYEIQVGVAYNEVGGVSGVELSGSGVESMNIVYSESLQVTTTPSGILPASHPCTDIHTSYHTEILTKISILQLFELAWFTCEPMML